MAKDEDGDEVVKAFGTLAKLLFPALFAVGGLGVGSGVTASIDWLGADAQQKRVAMVMQKLEDDKAVLEKCNHWRLVYKGRYQRLKGLELDDE